MRQDRAIDPHGKAPLPDDGAGGTRDSGTTAPTWLTKRANAEWSRVMRAVKELGTVTKLDRSVLAVRCYAVADYATAVLHQQEFGQVILSAKGTMVKNPTVDVANTSAGVIRQTAIELGFTPAARSNVVGKPKEQQSDFDKFMSEGGIKAAKQYMQRKIGRVESLA